MLSSTLLLIGSQPISGEAVIRGKTEDSEIVVTTTTRCAGAIHSLTWRGKEFLDSYDHGRQLQSASNFDAGSAITSETFNPTEAGSSQDGFGESSSSRLLSLNARSNQLETKSQMAFWLPPGGKSGQNFAKNLTVLSNHLLAKKVVIGAQGRPHLISYDVTFELPKDERHEYAVFESLTGYMPPEFSEFRILDAKAKELKPLSDGPGEQSHPIIFSTPDGNYAIGIYSSERQAKGYGRWRFSIEKVVKWNCVFRVQHPKPGGKFSFKHYIAVGTLEIVKKELVRLTDEV